MSSLDRAYRQVVSSDAASSMARQAIAAASKRINTICPGAAS